MARLTWLRSARRAIVVGALAVSVITVQLDTAGAASTTSSGATRVAPKGSPSVEPTELIAATPQPKVRASAAIVPGFDKFELPADDDGSTGLVKLPFAVNFYGKTYKSLYVNNNGNVTFAESLGQYTPSPLNALAVPMIAPFWADVDTRVGNAVKYGPGTVDGHSAFGVTWPAVGCYAEIDGVTNTFQLVLVSRPDTGKDNFDIEFHYGPIEWESGEASGGDSSCLGGVPARAGYTNGSVSYELPGSGLPGDFLSSNPTTGLSSQSYNSTEAGVDVFPVRSGQPGLGATNEYVALGDSYASGEGSFSYIGTAAPCYRATEGYAEQIATAYSYPLDFAACGGATIRNMVEGKSAQIDQVTKTTHLMTISVGGDSVGFSHVLASCIGGLFVKGGKGCAQRDETTAQAALAWLENGRPPGKYKLPGINSALNSGAPTEKNKVHLPGLAELYEELVARAAPGAQLIVIGYPDLFETARNPIENCQVGTAYGVDKLTIAASDVEWLNERANQLDEIVQSQAELASSKTGANIVFVDPRPAFYGGAVCDETGEEYINPLDLEYPSGKVNPEPESFHPTQEGQNILASELFGVIN